MMPDLLSFGTEQRRSKVIDRYTGKEMGHIFSLENKYAIWQEIEVLACEAQAELGTIGSR